MTLCHFSTGAPLRILRPPSPTIQPHDLQVLRNRIACRQLLNRGNLGSLSPQSGHGRLGPTDSAKTNAKSPNAPPTNTPNRLGPMSSISTLPWNGNLSSFIAARGGQFHFNRYVRLNTIRRRRSPALESNRQTWEITEIRLLAPLDQFALTDHKSEFNFSLRLVKVTFRIV